MSGRGRSNYGNRGYYRGGRGSGRGTSNYNKKSGNRRQDVTSTSKNNDEMKFTPHYPGKPQKITYDTLKDHIIIQIQKTFKNGQDIADLLRTETDKIPGTVPTRNTVTFTADEAKDDQARLNKQIEQGGYDLEYKEALRAYNMRKEIYEDNKSKAYAYIFTYCNRTMQNRIKESPDFETNIRNDPIALLREIKEKMYDPARAKYEYVSLTESFARIISDTKQEDKESLIDYTKRFKQSKDILKTTIGEDILHTFAERTKEYKDAKASDDKNEIKKKSFDKWITYLYLRNSDQRKYGTLMKNFRTQYSLGNNQYPDTLTKAADVLTNHPWDVTYKVSMKRKKSQLEDSKKKAELKKEDDKQNETSGTSFGQQKTEVKCYCCGKSGHLSPDCPDKDKIPREKWAMSKGTQMYTKEDKDKKDEDNSTKKTKNEKGWCGLQLNNHHCLTQELEPGFDTKESVILDTGSTFSAMCNNDLIAGVTNNEQIIEMKTNTGSRLITRKGTIPGMKHKVWHDPKSMTNIFSFAKLADEYRITYDSDKEDAFCIHTQSGIVKFKQNKEGLYYYNFPATYKEQVKKADSNGNNFVMTVEENKRNYTNQQFNRAKEARKLYHNIGAPTIKNYKRIIQSNMIRNCPVTVDDINIAEDIFGKDIAYLKGKTTRTTPKAVIKDKIKIPREIYERHNEITLHMDTIYINGMAFLTSIGYPICYRMCTPLPSTTHTDYYKIIDKALRTYNKGGFTIKYIYCDGKYRGMMDRICDDLHIHMNYTNAQDHESRAEQNN